MPRIQTEHTRLRYDPSTDQFELWLVIGNHTMLLSSISAEKAVEPNSSHEWACEVTRAASHLLYGYIREEIERQLDALADAGER